MPGGDIESVDPCSRAYTRLSILPLHLSGLDHNVGHIVVEF